MNSFRSAHRTARAFTLVELLVVIVIVAVLAVGGFTGYESLRRGADRSVALNQLRQIGAAIVAYGGENGGRFPGPMWPGQMPMIDPARDGRLSRDLAPYLGGPVPTQPELSSIFVPPAYRRAVDPARLNDSRTYVLNMEVPLEEGVVINPWGSLADPKGPQPMNQAMPPGNVWAMSDADRKNPRVASAAWSANTPAEPIHGRERHALYFDGRAATVSEEELARPMAR
jgi:prepilin-type N-terminal cleavage/methylation domain-containing protein